MRFGGCRTVVTGALLLAALAVSAPVRGQQVIYVSNTVGDDRNDGSAPTQEAPGVGPVATLARAFELARADQRIELVKTDKPYTESFFVGRPGVGGIEGHPIVIEGNGAELRGFAPVPPSAWRYLGEGTYRMQPARKGYYLLLVDGNVAERVEYRPVEGAARPQLQPLQWTVRSGYIYVRIPEGRYIDQLRIEIPGSDVGLGFYGANHVVVRNLTITGYRLDGIHVHGDARGIQFRNVTCRLNGRSGIAVGGTARVEVFECQMQTNLVADVYCYGSGRVTLHEGRLLGGGLYLVDARGGSVRLLGCTLGSYLRDRFRERGGTVSIEQSTSGP